MHAPPVNQSVRCAVFGAVLLYICHIASLQVIDYLQDVNDIAIVVRGRANEYIIVEATRKNYAHTEATRGEYNGAIPNRTTT